jgi:hypothetical protein
MSSLLGLRFGGMDQCAVMPDCRLSAFSADSNVNWALGIARMSHVNPRPVVPRIGLAMRTIEEVFTKFRLC